MRTSWSRRLFCAVGVVALGTAVPVASAGASRLPASTHHPTVAVGGFPTGISLDPATDTIYVGNGTTDDVSLINGKTCNASVTTGCGHKVVAVTAGTDPIGSAVDQTTDTLYVANASSDSAAAIDGRLCNASVTTGCRREPGTVAVGAGPEFLAVDAATDTIYVANFDGTTVSVINGKTCNAATLSTCKGVRATVHVGSEPLGIAVNPDTDSIYVTDTGSDTVSVIDGKTCSGTVTSGCSHVPVTVRVGYGPGGVAVNAVTDTVYVTAEDSDNVSVIDGQTCNASVTTGCRAVPLTVRAGAGARGIAVDQTTDTVYVANTDADTVSVINGATCDSTDHKGCAQVAATAHVGSSPRRVAVDATTNTVYVTNADSDTVSVIDGRTCDAAVHSGC